MALPQCAILAYFLVAAVLVRGVKAWKPTMHPDTDELILKEGDELRISCRGDGPIHFSTMNIPETVYDISIDKASGEYTFVIHHAYANNTGWYACAAEGVEIKNDELTIDHPDTEISWIYVYVNSATEPFAVAHTFHPLLVRAGTTAVLPCRPTSPDYQVELYSFSNPEPLEDTEFDPKIGFIFRTVTLDQAAIYECKIVGQDSKDNPAYELQVTTRRNPSSPIIDEAALHHVVWGKNQTLTCSIIMSSEIRFALTWKAPSSVPKDRLIHDEKSEYEGGYVTHRAFLTIVNVQEHDGGEYECTLKDENQNVATQTTHLKIWDPNYVYLNLSLGDDGEASLQLREGDVAQWRLTIDSYPENVTWMWYKGNSANSFEDVTAFENSRYSHVYDGKSHLFKIAGLDVNDTSDYTIRASTPYNVKDIIVHLNVEGQPQINKSRDSTSA